MATLWEILTQKKKPGPKPAELQIYNPLQLVSTGEHPSIVEIHTVDLDKLRFKLKSIRERDREHHGNTSKLVDYDLFARDLQSAVYDRRLKLVPLEDPDGDLTHSVLLLKLDDEYEQNDDLIAKLNDTTKANPDDPDLHDDGDGSDWWRVNDAKTAWDAVWTTFQNRDHATKISAEEAEKACWRRGDLKYWDFYRQTEVDGVSVVEFLIFELDDNFMQQWRGVEIDPHRIEVTQGV